MDCPQGSVLGPTLWNILMDNSLRLPQSDGVRLVAYANDTALLPEKVINDHNEGKSPETLYYYIKGQLNQGGVIGDPPGGDTPLFRSHSMLLPYRRRRRKSLASCPGCLRRLGEYNRKR
ncbi:Retrovirus-related Pol polyprotein from type-1 retrotransposable element R1 2 [Eumeta japonica]|uniref:Retrovirus-related Pol polyprotein from type-1 retrotransposable element R1 2 n=1 Tax=Eumeta variegata TaxID=151549 RepID=A0A4C1U5I8_EUMVA|nr:Retrovirus-related Pol polyprotein from type-1 retrotransposable element R1 2 [Eumeta japonica]